MKDPRLDLRFARPLVVGVACALSGFVAGRLCSTESAPVENLAQGQTASGGADANSSATPAEPLPPAPVPKPTQEELRAALKDKDVFRGAAVVLAWVESAGLEDLRAFIHDPKSLSPYTNPGLEGDFQTVLVDAVMERLLTMAPGDLKLVSQTKLMDEERHRFHLLSEAAARRKPGLVLAEALQSEVPGDWEKAAATAFTTLGAKDPAAARRLLEKVTDPRRKAGFEISILEGAAKMDVFAAASALSAGKYDEHTVGYGQTIGAIVDAAEQSGPGVLRRLRTEHPEVFASYWQSPRLLLRYPDLAEDLAQGEKPATTPGLAPTMALCRDADSMTEEARAKVIANFDRLPPSARDALSGAVVAAWARAEPAEATAWALAHAKPDEPADAVNSAARFAFIRWTMADPVAALASWEQMPASPLRDAIGTNLAPRFAATGDFETARKMIRPTPGDGLQVCEVVHFAQLYAGQDPAAAATWLTTLPAGTGGENAMEPVGRAYYRHDPTGAMAWLETLPDGPLRASALKQIIGEAAGTDSAGAAERVTQMADPKMRATASELLAARWRFGDPETARAWVEKQPEAKWRTDFLAK